MNSLRKEKWCDRKILVTGGAGFIGSYLAERLLEEGASVVVLDNLSTGKRENLEPFYAHEKRFEFIEGDLRDPEVCKKAVSGCDFVLHEAALGSVPRSIADPLTTFDVNARGFANIITAAKDAGVKRFVYASSSSVYGDDSSAVKVEEKTGNLLSPYAVSKRSNELLALNFGKVYNFKTIGLRYFNVIGKRQDATSPYAAVIPRFIAALKAHQSPTIYGDGTNARDFTHVQNVVEANLCALTTNHQDAFHRIYNIACGKSTSLIELFYLLRAEMAKHDPEVSGIEPLFGPPRQGDIANSLAEISSAAEFLQYNPIFHLQEAIALLFSAESDGKKCRIYRPQ